MSQSALFHETLADAIRDAISAAGGTKQVASKLWPEKTQEAAARLLSDCLNEHRAERLCPEQLMLIARMGREHGCHSIMLWIARDTGYSDPTPIEPEDERAELMREFIESERRLEKLAARMQRVGMLRSAA